MKWDETYSNDITRLAESAFTPKQIAWSLGIAPKDFKAWMEDENHPCTIAYWKGYNSSLLAVRESIMQLARNGSSPAQTLAVKIFLDTNNILKHEGFIEGED